ncbi:MAG TPA: hypothetical protein DCQ94_16450, partial [Nitrospira sp.]|nr:hypothetical protein [Nitrospira sp.]
MAERRIAEGVPQSDDIKPGPPRDDAKGIICYISNFRWLEGSSHPGMRERFMEVFDSISIDCLNGDSRETGKKTPDGKPDPSVFSTEKNREGIKVGTAIALMERRPEKKVKTKFKPADATTYTPRAELHFRHWWGKNKRVELEASLEKPKAWQKIIPAMTFGLPFVPLGVRADYGKWSAVADLFAYSSYGFLTNRDEALVSIDREPLAERMKTYFDKSVSDREISRRAPALMRDTGRFEAKATRDYLLTKGFESGEIVRLNYRPFDVRWLYWQPETKLVEERR